MRWKASVKPGALQSSVTGFGRRCRVFDQLDVRAVEVLCAPGDFEAVKAALAAAGFKPELAEITMKPSAEAALAAADAARMRQLLDALENLDDVQDVYTTAVID